MSNAQALLDCTFGWGKTCRLYTDSIEVAGKLYNLDELTAIYPTYRTILGVPSARLELFFGPRHLVLRGIPDQEIARLLVTHLQLYCDAESPTTRAHSRSAQARRVAREQARTWERSSKLPAIPVSPEERDFFHILEKPEHAPSAQERVDEAALTVARADLIQPEVTPGTHDEPLSAQAVPAGSDGLESAAPLYGPADSWPAMRSQPLHTPRFQPPLRSVHLIAPGQKIDDTCSMPVAAVRSSVLPVIHVPVRLQPGECAHYSIGASLCSDRISGSDRAPYPPLDHGLLILTNRRIFYIGKRSQLILAYTHLWYVSLLHNAIALHIEKQFRRIIIELEHPHEWASRIEQLSFIARRAQPRSELPTLLMAALPGLPPSSLDAATLKRPALKAPARKVQKEAETSPRPEPGESKIVEAQTISLNEEAQQACADEKTQDIPLSGAQEKSAAQETSRPSEQSDASRQETLAAMATQDFPLPENLVEAATQELAQPLAVEERKTQELAPAPASEKAGVESARRRQTPDEPEVKTCALNDPAVPLSREEDNFEEIDTLPLHRTTEALKDEEAQTISLREHAPARAAEAAPKAPISARFPDIEITPRCLTHRRGMRPPVRPKVGRPN